MNMLPADAILMALDVTLNDDANASSYAAERVAAVTADLTATGKDEKEGLRTLLRTLIDAADDAVQSNACDADGEKRLVAFHAGLRAALQAVSS